MALFLVPVVAGLWQMRRLRRAALPWPEGQAAAERLALDAGIYRRFEVLVHEALPGPMTCGVIRPAIVLSADAQTWEMDDLNRAIVHELEHVRRSDFLSHSLARGICVLYWFHPLVWIARRRLALEAERCCDDAVLECSEPTAYADQLVQLARRLSSAAKSPVLAMANRADLTTRVGAVLDSRQRRGRAGALPVAIASAAAALCVITISPLQMVAAQQASSTSAEATPTARLSTTTGLVIEAVTVTDANGKTIEGLSANDFAITEDGAPQRIMVFEFQKLDGGAQGNDSVSSYYILGYYPRNQNADGAFRQIKVTSKVDATAKLRYRLGYYASKSFTRFNGASATAANSTAVRSAAPGVTPPGLISKVEPAYSEEARKAKFQGHVVLSVDIDATGRVTDAKVMKPLGLGLDEKAIEAVKQWRFSPGRAAQVEVEMDFRLL
jgi:TonB family protein